MSSKCQIGKYRPGGRCGGDSGVGVKKDAGSLGGAFSALLAAREQLDAACAAPAEPAAKTDAITLFTSSKKGDAAHQRKADIDLILDD
jgi:hypothetical protein